MRVAYFNLLCIAILVMYGCDSDGIVGDRLEPHCEGISLIGEWQGQDKVIYQHEWRRDTVIEDYTMIFYGNGIGKENGNDDGHFTFFKWAYQCDPDRLLFTFYPNQTDSLASFDSSIFFDHANYDITENTFNSKLMNFDEPWSDTSFTNTERMIWRN